LRSVPIFIFDSSATLRPIGALQPLRLFLLKKLYLAEKNRTTTNPASPSWKSARWQLMVEAGEHLQALKRLLASWKILRKKFKKRPILS
jgi:hypothetical protein